MKARIRKTGEIIEVTRNKDGFYVDRNNVGYTLKDLDFGNEENEHWQDVRERAAIAAMQGLSANPNLLNVNGYEKIDITARAMRYADDIVKKLKKK